MQKVIAMAANYKYINQVETTIKSLLYNNFNIDVYLMNSDIPNEWFKTLNTKMNIVGSRIIDEKVDPGLLNNEHISQTHLNTIAYAKFFVPERIDAERVIYLDSDVIVNSSIEELFEIEFNDDQLVAAAQEVENSSYNDGVIVYNNKRLREISNVVQTLLDLGKNDQLHNGDQSVFNDYFKDNIKLLSSEYNYEIGMDRWAFVQNRTDMLEKLASIRNPKIIHYANNDKPWNQFSSGRMRDLWWKYYAMDWSKIINHIQENNHKTEKIVSIKEIGNLFTLTNDQNLACLEELVKALPNWHFHIAAYTYMGWKLNKMSQYSNVSLYPIVLQYRLDQLVNDSDIYLDINYGPKDEKVIKRFAETGKPILAFESTKSNEQDAQNYLTVNDNNLSEIINYIRNYN